MPSITLFELGPTRSARVRWMLLEAGLAYELVGNRGRNYWQRRTTKHSSAREIACRDLLTGNHCLNRQPL